MINKYVIYGERHSGTKFLDKILRNFNITPTNIFGHKHFFRPEYIFDNLNEISSTIFFCIVRNPYDWLLAMHKQPHHCGISNYKEIYRFLSQPWFSRELFLGQEILADRHLYNNKKYNNVFDMRTNKINYLKNILPIYVPHYVFIRYEDFLQKKIVEFFIKKLIKKYNISYQSNFIEVFNNKKAYYNILDETLLNYINNSINWKLENQIGYLQANTIDQLKVSS